MPRTGLATATFLVLSLALLMWLPKGSCMSAKRPSGAKHISTTERKNNYYLALETKCRDSYPRCLEERCTTSPKWMMRRACKKTCGYCRAFSPPACFRSPYGCCWDYITSALGPSGEGCPPCADNTRYPYVCRRFRSYCRRKGISGLWMRTNCPDACGHCEIWQF